MYIQLFIKFTLQNSIVIPLLGRYPPKSGLTFIPKRFGTPMLMKYTRCTTYIGVCVYKMFETIRMYICM